MQSIQKHIPFVKEQIAHYERMVVKFRSDPNKTKYTEVAKNLRALLSDMEDCHALLSLPDTVEPFANQDFSSLSSKLPANFFSNPLALQPNDYIGVDKDFLEQLNITESDKLESTIVDLINAGGGTLVLDKILLGLYHLTGEKHQRVQMTSRLYKMAKKKLVFSVPKKKGVYTTNSPKQDDTKNVVIDWSQNKEKLS